MDIGERIKRRRNEIGLTLKEVADKIGVKDATVQRYESGNIKTLKQETVGKLAEVLRVTPSYLMGWDDLPDNVTPISDLPMIPVVGEIAAGIPILAEENIIGYIPTDIANPQDYFYLHVKGDSMINAEITNGSDVLILRQNCADNGDIGVLLLAFYRISFPVVDVWKVALRLRLCAFLPIWHSAAFSGKFAFSCKIRVRFWMMGALFFVLFHPAVNRIDDILVKRFSHRIRRGLYFRFVPFWDIRIQPVIVCSVVFKFCPGGRVLFFIWHEDISYHNLLTTIIPYLLY